MSPEEIYRINTTIDGYNGMNITGITRFYIIDTLFSYRHTPPDQSLNLMITTTMDRRASFRNFSDQFVLLSNPFILTEDILNSMECAINRFFVFPNLYNAISKYYYVGDCTLTDHEVFPIGKYIFSDDISCIVFIIQAKCNDRLFWSVNYAVEKSITERKQGDIGFGYKDSFDGMSFGTEDYQLKFINNGKEIIIDIFI